MDLGIAGRVAVVSGGSEGQGLATARALLAEGCKVLIASRTAATLESARAGLDADTPGRVAAMAADMTDAAQVAAVVAAARNIFGAVDIAVSNVIGHVIKGDEAGPRAGDFAGAASGDYAVEFKQLMLSAWWLAREVIPQMKARGWGRIFNIGSGVAREPQWEIPHILPNTVRPAVAGLHRSLSVELAPFGITVNNMMSGSIATQRNIDYFTWLANEREEAFEDTVSAFHLRLPLRRPGRPQDMGNAIAFLCSEQARAITGQSFAVVGGSLRHLY